MWKNYLKIALRTLQKQKGYALISTASLAVGVACCVLIALYVRHELSYDRFHEKADRLYQVITAMERGEQTTRMALTPVPMAEALRETYPEIERIVSLRPGDAVVRRGSEAFEEEVLFASPEFFEAFSFELVQGDPVRALQAPDAVVLTRPAAQKFFGTENAVGQRLSIRLQDTFYDFTVSAVAKPPPATSSIQFDVLLPFSRVSDYGRATRSWRTSSPRIYVELSNPRQAGQLEEKFSSFVATYLPEDMQASTRFTLLPLTETHFATGIMGQLEPASRPIYVYILGGIALFILLIACINFMTLAVGRSAGRTREIGMRKAMGARRRQLMGQFWGEAMLLTGLALLLALVLARLFVPVFNDLVGRSLSFGMWTEPLMLAVLLGILLVTGLLAGSYPALHLSRFEPARVLKGQQQVQGPSRLTRGLIVVQFALAFFLIISTVFMTRQMSLLQTKDLGFNEEQVVRINARLAEDDNLLEQYSNRLASEPSVVDVSGSLINTLGGNEGLGYSANAVPIQGGGEVEAKSMTVAPGFFETLDIELVEGRGFAWGEEQPGIVVNQAFADAAGWDTAIGKRIDTRLQHLQNVPIIGVTENFHYETLHNPVTPLYMPVSTNVSYVYIRLAAGQTAEGLEAVRAAWSAAAPDLPFSYTFLDEAVEAQYRAEERWQQIVTYSAGLAVLLACLGLFGVAALAAVRRTKEIGIRKVLGASVANIVALLSKEFLLLISIAFAAAVPAAYVAMQRWLQGFAYRTELAPWIFAATGAGLIVLAVATVGVQALRAALANPADTLRNE